MFFVELIGYTAATLTTAAFLPQLLMVMKTKSTRDISLGMFLMFSIGVFCWLIYGLMIQSVPVVAANTVVFVLATVILGYKLRYK